jgi:hypothetical protein
MSQFMRRLLNGFSFVMLGSAVTLVLLDGVAAQPSPVPGPPLPVLEQNRDANGFIRVHEQGTSTVNVANGSLSVNGSVSVSNFPSVSDVNVKDTTPVSAAFIQTLTAGPDESADVEFGTINATSITFSAISSSPEFVLYVRSPLSTFDYGGLPNTLFRLSDSDGDDIFGPERTFSFTRPVPIFGLRMYCWNEEDLCQILATILGS